MLAPKFALDWTTGVPQPGVDVARTGVATFVGSNGFIQSASQDTQRIDWLTGQAGILIEDSRTNLQIRSQQFNTAWSPSAATISSATENSPDNTQSADTLIESNTNDWHYVAFFSHTPVIATPYTMSVFAKKKEREFVQLYLPSSAFGGSNAANGAVFNLTTGAIAVQGSALASASITNYGNGWYRCSITKAATSTTAFPFVITLRDAGTFSVGAYQGNGTSGIYIWGAQLEAGNSVSSYIPTEATAVTRNADVATITGTNFSDFWQASKGGVLVRARPGTVSGTRPWVQFDDNTADNIIALRGNGTNPELYIVDGGVAQAQIDAGTIAANTNYRLTGWWATNDCKARLDNGAVVTDTTATIPTVTQARLGSDGTNYLNGHLASISYYENFTGVGSYIYTRRKNKAVFNLM